MMMAVTIMMGMTTQANAQTPDQKVWPWDFPKNMEIDAEAGQKALSCQMHYFETIKKGETLIKQPMIWYDTKIAEPGKEKTTIDEYGDKIEVPNALIIPLSKEAKTKKGDMVLTHTRYHDMQRAIVIDASTPTEPVVCFLDESWPDKVDSKELPEKQKGEKLEAGSFNVLKDGVFMPGNQVAYKKGSDWKFGKIVQASDDKLLVCGFASRLDCVDKADCTLIPLKQKIKVGDKVRVVDLDEYAPDYVVIKVDQEHGHVWVKHEKGTNTHCHGVLDVTKTLK